LPRYKALQGIDFRQLQLKKIPMGHWMPVKQVCDLNSLSLQNVEALANGETPNYTFYLRAGQPPFLKVIRE